MSYKMSEFRPSEGEQASYDFRDIFSTLYSRAYMAHITGGDFVRAFEKVELVGIKDPYTRQHFILGRPQLNSAPTLDILYWMHTYTPRTPLRNYTLAELSLAVREPDPVHLYVYTNGEFAPCSESEDQLITDMLMRSDPAPLN